MRADGYFEVTDPEKGVIKGDTLQCGHCGRHFAVRPGSGTKRGWCLKCMKVTCGGPDCVECTPFEKRLEAWEIREKLRCR